jgi:MYXO-CTERM domain-containing protein
MPRLVALLATAAALAACGPGLDDDAFGSLALPLNAHCSINVVGKGTKDLESDYLPHVVNCENGGASAEALKVQAVSARTFAYYKIATAGSVKDGTSDQVYSCSSQPSQKHIDAVKATAGQVLVWSNAVICAFFVAGAKPSTTSCVAKASDPDPTSTEKYVTYNDGKTGSAVTQTPLGWVNPANKVNRGCMSQNGSQCQSLKGKGYKDILRFYYGADIQITTAVGSCVPKPPAQVDATPVKKDGAAHPTLDGGAPHAEAGPEADSEAPRIDHGAPPSGPSGARAEGGCAVGGQPAGGPSVLALLLVALLSGARARRRR